MLAAGVRRCLQCSASHTHRHSHHTQESRADGAALDSQGNGHKTEARVTDFNVVHS